MNRRYRKWTQWEGAGSTAGRAEVSRGEQERHGTFRFE